MAIEAPAAARTKRKPLPDNLPPRLVSRVQAAAYVGVSATTFDRMIDDHLMPKPLRVYGRRLWDVRKLDAAIDALDSSENPDDPWGGMKL